MNPPEEIESINKVWVKGHSDEIGNNLSFAVRHGDNRDTNTREYHAPSINERNSNATLCFGETEIDIDDRKWLKFQFQAANSKLLMDVKWIREMIQPVEAGGKLRISWYIPNLECRNETV